MRRIVSSTMTLLILALAFCLLVGLLSAPATASTYKLIKNDYFKNGDPPLHLTDPGISTVTITIPEFPNNSTPTYIYLNVTSPSYANMNVELFVGHFVDYYSDLRFYLSGIDPVPDGNGTYQAYVYIYQYEASTPTAPGTVMNCDTPGLKALGGDTVIFVIEIKNNYDADKTYALSTKSDPGYVPVFKYNNKELSEIYVPAGQSKKVDLDVEVPYVTAVGQHTITAIAGDASLDVRVDVTSINQSADVNVQLNSQIANIGESVYYEFGIENLRAQQDNYYLSVTGLPDNWDYQYLASRTSTGQMSEVVVPAQGKSSLVLKVLPPYSVTEGTYNFTAAITNSDNVTISKPLTLTLKGSIGMSVGYDRLSYTARPGEAFDIKVYVTNTGNGGALTNVYPDITTSSGWIVTSSPNVTNSIRPGETQAYTLTVTPPGNIVPSDYEVNVLVKSDQAQVEKDFRIVIETTSYTVWIAGAVIVAVVAGLLLMFKVYGRK